MIIHPTFGSQLRFARSIDNMAAQVVEEAPAVDVAKAEELKAAANAAFQGTYGRSCVFLMVSFEYMKR